MEEAGAARAITTITMPTLVISRTTISAAVSTAITAAAVVTTISTAITAAGDVHTPARAARMGR